jgi:hypothetical protein
MIQKYVSHHSHQFIIMFLIISESDDEKHDEKLMRVMRNLPKKESDRTRATFSNSLLLLLAFCWLIFPYALTGCCSCLHVSMSPCLQYYTPGEARRPLTVQIKEGTMVSTLPPPPPCPIFLDISASCIDFILILSGL